METINHECYVSLEIAKLLKKAGFDWRCETCYIGKSKRLYKYNKYFNWNLPRKYFEKDGSDNLFHSFINQKKTNNFISAPTLDVAQRWLRVVKGIYIGINAIENKRAVTNSDGWTFHYEYGKPTFDCDIKDERCENMCTLYDSFDTYEEAQEAGIKKILEIILEKEK